MQMSGIEGLPSEESDNTGTSLMPFLCSTSTPKEVYKHATFDCWKKRNNDEKSSQPGFNRSFVPVEFESSVQISFDAGELVDENDPDYFPSEWDISMNVEPPDGQVVDVDINVDVHDIDFENEDEQSVDVDTSVTGFIKLCHVGKEDEEDPMVMVSASCLQTLTSLVPHTTCCKCGEPTIVNRHTEGCGWKLKWECENRHVSFTWASQPVLPNGVMLGNFKMAASIILSGNNYAKIALLCKFLRIGIPSQTSFNKIQSHFVVPVVNAYWQNMKSSIQDEYKLSDIVIAGDGRMDSPGHTANYCTYTMMAQDGKKILAMEVIDKRECQLVSNRMEAKGFVRAMDDILGAGLKVKEVVTDAHPQIGSIMKKQFPQIRHSWDMWHGAKNMGKKLCAAASEKGNEQLKPWVSDITNHFYYSAEQCNGDVLLLKDKLFSLTKHCTNKHVWGLGRCDHGPINEDARDKEWLNPLGSEMKALRKILSDRRFTNNLHHYITCQTTSELESFNNHLLMYVSKRHGFSFPVYRCRSFLAAIDYMYHIDRPVRKTKDGKPYYSRTFSKAANHWTFKNRKEPKTYDYIPDLMVEILNLYTLHNKELPISGKVVLGQDDPRRIATTIAPSTPPETNELVEQYKSRLENWPRPSTSNVTE